MEPQKTKSLNTVETKQNPCRILYLPKIQQVIAACYTYNPDTKTRIGSIEVFTPY